MVLLFGGASAITVTGMSASLNASATYRWQYIDLNFDINGLNSGGTPVRLVDVNIFAEKLVDSNTIIAQDTDHNVMTSANMTAKFRCDGNISDFNSAACGFVLDSNSIVDGNYHIIINAGALDSTGDTNTWVSYTLTSTATLTIDNNFPTYARLDVDSNGTSNWRTADYNMIVVDANFYISGINSTASYYAIDGGTHNTLIKTTNGTQDYNIYVPITTDGNHVVTVYLQDNAGNNRTLTFPAIGLDKTVPVVAAARVTGFSGADVDNFYGWDQNIRVKLTPLDTSSIAYLDVNFYDVNGSTGWVRAAAGGDANTYDVNLKRNWDRDFNVTTLKIRVTDVAGNSTGSLDMNDPVILYDMNYAPGTTKDGNSTNFQGIMNFADINSLKFQDDQNRGKIEYINQDINLSTYAQAMKLVALQNALTMDVDDAGNHYVSMDSTIFSDINKAAIVTIYNLPYATMPPIKMGDDANCTSTFCYGISYGTSTHQLDFNVLHFTKYTADDNAPVFTLSATTTTTTATVSVTSDERVTCRYGSDLVAYDSMSSATQETVIASTLTALPVKTGYPTGASATLYVQCRDPVGHDTNSSITFDLKTENNTGSAPAGGTSGTPATTPTTTVESTSSDTFSPTADEVTSLLEGSGLTEAEIAEYAADAASGEIAVERALVVEKTVTSGVTSYKSTFTVTVKNSSTKDMADVKVVETVPKNVAADASSISSVYQFTVLNADPVLEFIIPSVDAGQTAIVTYSVDKKVTAAEFGAMNSPVAKFTEATTPPATPPVTPPITPPVTPPVTPGTGTETPAQAQPADYTMLIAALLLIIIVVAVLYIGRDKIVGKKNKPVTIWPKNKGAGK
ncbi:MAG: hypothetical protein NTZ73_00455 [Candidatus Diapherotrites archaeon]|nr:hypothetical protein [Candidatus Diapherotrites archaeon]